MPDRSSPGFVIQVSSSAPETRIAGHADTRTMGQVLDRMADVTARVLSFEFEDCEREHDVLRLRVDNHDHYFFEHPAWIKGNVVKFFFGYPGQIFGPRYAIIDSIRGHLVLDISCVEEAALANEAKDRIFEATTRAAIVRAMVSEGAFQGVINIDIDESALGDEQPRDWTQARQTDWQFLQRLAEAPGFEVFIEDDTLHFHPRRLSRAPARKFEYHYGIGALIEVNIEEFRVADRTASVEVAGRDPIQKKNISSTGSDSTTERETLGNQGSLVIERKRDGSLVAGKKIMPTPTTDPATARQQADAMFRMGEQDEIKLTATIQGDPTLQAKQVVEVQGIPTLAGNYYIEKHVHKIDNTGYRGTLHLLRNALTSLPTTEPPVLDSTKINENREKVPTDRRQVIVRDPVTGDLYQKPKS